MKETKQNVQIRIRLPEAHYESLRRLAEARLLDPDDLAREAMAEYLTKREAMPKVNGN